jgi:hypothetical protein
VSDRSSAGIGLRARSELAVELEGQLRRGGIEPRVAVSSEVFGSPLGVSEQVFLPRHRVQVCI